MNFLSLFVLIPLLTLLVFGSVRNIAQIRAVMVTGASALLVLSAALTVMYLNARHAGATDEMLFRATWLVSCTQHPLFGRSRRYFGSHAAAFGHHCLYRNIRLLEAATAD